MQNIIIRHGEEKDISAANNILTLAKLYFKENKIDQWQDANGYPNEIDLNEDMKNNAWYVVQINDDIVASFMSDVIIDDTYIKKAVKGDWLTSGTKYGVLHRIAMHPEFKGRGIAGKIVEFAKTISIEKNAVSLRSDTHEDNISMQNMLIKNNFVKCGEIILPSGAPRIIFENVFN